MTQTKRTIVRLCTATRIQNVGTQIGTAKIVDGNGKNVNQYARRFLKQYIINEYETR